jgi:hypothetical protein
MIPSLGVAALAFFSMQSVQGVQGCLPYAVFIPFDFNGHTPFAREENL